MKKILAIIPARGGSKGIPGKNLSNLCRKPLIKWTIDEAKKSNLIDKIILSSDDNEIIEYCRKQGIEVPFKRPKNFAKDNTPMLPVIKHAINFLKVNKKYVPDYILLLQPTSPLRTYKHIDEALNLLMSSDADSVVSVVEVPHNFNPYSVMKLKNGYLKPFLKYNENMNLRQKKPKFYARNGAAIYAFKFNCLIKKNSIYGDKILPYFMKREESIDIDEKFDLELAEVIIKKNKFLWT